MNKTMEARHQIEQLVAGNSTCLDELLRLRAQLGELENPVTPAEMMKLSSKKLATGPLSQIYQPTTPRR